MHKPDLRTPRWHTDGGVPAVLRPLRCYGSGLGEFAAQVITRDLPAGFTELDADGQWMNQGTRQISRQRSKVVIVAVPDTPVTASAIAHIKDEYRQRFAQIVVGTVVHPVCAAF
jgi:hypothetical protein